MTTNSSPSTKRNKIKNHIKYLTGIIDRVKKVLKALEAGDPEPAKLLARESIAKNEAFLKASKAALAKA